MLYDSPAPGLCGGDPPEHPHPPRSDGPDLLPRAVGSGAEAGARGPAGHRPRGVGGTSSSASWRSRIPACAELTTRLDVFRHAPRHGAPAAGRCLERKAAAPEAGRGPAPFRPCRRQRDVAVRGGQLPRRARRRARPAAPRRALLLLLG
ncbi:MAG: hypothetical protein MZW92_01180 [Comamonadaceae bacterium]|nr:hypothetical protein [Comamonadaceae bacterium]